MRYAEKICYVMAVVLLSTVGVYGQVTVVKGGSSKSMLDMSGLKGSEGAGERLFLKTLEEDLIRSGWFTIVKDAKATYVVQGTCRESGGSMSVRCQVDNALNAASLMNKQFSGTSAQARRLAHNVADEIVFAVKKIRGIASTRIALVGMRGAKKDLYVCDADGANMVQITHDNAMYRFLNWSPDAQRLLFTSYQSGYPDVYMMEMSSYSKRRIAAFPGLNAGATYSPDGKNIALVLSKDGNPELYVMSASGGNLVRLTKTPYATEASPSWSPDGSQIVYVTDKTGRPQLWVIGRDGGAPRRITSRGSENVSPDWGGDGRIAYTSMRDGRYQVCVTDLLANKEEQISTEYFNHEDPSWAPDSRHIICSRTQNYHSDLYILDTLGDRPVRLTNVQGEWYAPAWSSK